CKILVERDVDGVEEPGDLVEPALVEGPALPESRAVEMERGTALARLVAGRYEIVPRRKLPAELALRQLEQQRRDRLPNLVEVAGRRKTFAGTKVARKQAVQVLVPALLMCLDVTMRVKGTPLAPSMLGMAA